jgi:hypothetical protein
VQGVLGIIKAWIGSSKPSAPKGFDSKEILISKVRQDPLWILYPPKLLKERHLLSITDRNQQSHYPRGI